MGSTVLPFYTGGSMTSKETSRPRGYEALETRYARCGIGNVRCGMWHVRSCLGRGLI